MEIDDITKEITQWAQSRFTACPKMTINEIAWEIYKKASNTECNLSTLMIEERARMILKDLIPPITGIAEVSGLSQVHYNMIQVAYKLLMEKFKVDEVYINMRLPSLPIENKEKMDLLREMGYDKIPIPDIFLHAESGWIWVECESCGYKSRGLTHKANKLTGKIYEKLQYAKTYHGGYSYFIFGIPEKLPIIDREKIEEIVNRRAGEQKLPLRILYLPIG